MNSVATDAAFIITLYALPGCTLLPIIFISTLDALKFSYSSSPISPPSTVYAKSVLKPSTSKKSAPLPTSSSGVKQTFISECSICGFSIIYFKASIISVIPALSSAPSRVVPSEVIIVFPIFCDKIENSLGDKTIFFSLFTIISPPS